MWMLTLGLVTDAQAQAEDPLIRRVARNSAVGDFDGDGLGDAVYGDSTSGSDSACAAGYGAAFVHYGDDPETGVRLARGAGLLGVATCGAALGAGLGAGDIDGDGYDDLVLGLSGLAVGQIQVVYGSASGLSATRQTTLTGPSIDGTAAGFGATLASGDFDCDGYDDVAVGAPDANVGAVVDAGEVSVYRGQSLGISTTGTRYVQSAFGDAPETGDRFGYALAAGDLDGVSPGVCGCDDLAISAANEDWSGVADAGLVHVSYGGRSGVNGGGTDLIQPTGVLGPVRGQAMGSNLAIGDVDLDGVDDLTLLLGASDQLAWLEGGPSGVGAVTLGADELPSDSACAATEKKGTATLVWIEINPTCDQCCGPGNCCIGGSCGG